jgi:hypothetical protein
MSFAGPVPGVLGAAIRDAASLPAHLSKAARVDPWTEAAPGALLFEVPGIARYLVENGTAINVAAEAGADPAAVTLFLHGSARGSLIHQRGELPLEATTVVAPNGNAIALSSFSGLGKSTVAATLCRRGWTLLADDITRVTWSRGRALAWPSHDSLKLWRDACEQLGVDTAQLSPARRGMEKFHVKMPAATAPAVLKAVIRLQRDNFVKLGDVRASAPALSECTFRWRQIAPLGQQVAHEELVRQIAGVCSVLALTGAREFALDTLADEIVKAAS